MLKMDLEPAKVEICQFLKGRERATLAEIRSGVKTRHPLIFVLALSELEREGAVLNMEGGTFWAINSPFADRYLQ
ncbi:MAG: hypothetical protein ACFFCO_13055 [Promethearchaeota archaeon]